MGRMNATSYGPTEPHLWLVGKFPPKTWENCRDTSERMLGRTPTMVALYKENFQKLRFSSSPR